MSSGSRLARLERLEQAMRPDAPFPCLTFDFTSDASGAYEPAWLRVLGGDRVWLRDPGETVDAFTERVRRECGQSRAVLMTADGGP
jgi:hypothetical protein